MSKTLVISQAGFQVLKCFLLNFPPELRPAGGGEDGADEAQLEEGGRNVEHDGLEHGGDAAGAAVDCLKCKKR